MSTPIFVVSTILALAVLSVPIAGYLNRKGNEGQRAKGIGWQFIRYTVIAMALPLAGILALNGALTPEVATIIATALAFAFGKTNEA